MIAAILAALARLVSGATVRWVGCQPDARQRIYFGNHTSHLDFVVLWSALPPAVRALTRPVAARDYWGRGTLRRALITRVFNGVLVERGGDGARSADEKVRAARASIDRLVEALGDRHSLIVFPEGTRSSGDEVGPFKSGLYHLGMRVPEIELVPVYLENLNRILPKGEVLPVPLLSSVTFGPPIRLLAGESKEAFLMRARGQLRNLRQA